MSHKKLRPFIVKVSVLGYFPLYIYQVPLILAKTCFYRDKITKTSKDYIYHVKTR